MSESLDRLKDTWFIDTVDDSVFPPPCHHPNTLVGSGTDGNRLVLLPSGAAMMADGGVPRQ